MPYIICNNWRPGDAAVDKFHYPGAIVGDPKLNPKSLDSKFKNIFTNVFDLDFSAYYPSVIIAGNIHPTTLLFKIRVPIYQFFTGKLNNSLNWRNRELDYYVLGDKKSKKITMDKLIDLYNNKDSPVAKTVNWDKMDYIMDGASDIIDSFKSGNAMTFAENYFNYPTATEIYDELKK
jgi:hypothetical protein